MVAYSLFFTGFYCRLFLSSVFVVCFRRLLLPIGLKVFLFAVFPGGALCFVSLSELSGPFSAGSGLEVYPIYIHKIVSLSTVTGRIKTNMRTGVILAKQQL